jgi:glycosyltransferase involved in cell wall biosynthesis
VRILIALTYYRPHYSGLTIYTERLARSLAGRGHQVTVLTSRFDPKMPAVEMQNGVQVVRPWVLMRISKGVLMPQMPFWALRLIRQADVVNLHVPQLDAAPIALLARAVERPVVLTYHCDLHLPKGAIHWVANQASHFANRISSAAAQVIVTNTRDYAEQSQFLRQRLSKVMVVPPPAELPTVSEREVQSFCERYQIQADRPIIGMVARLATEKGAEYVVAAMPKVLERYPQAQLLFVGQYQNVLGEEAYAQRLQPGIDRLGTAWRFLGVLTPEDLAAFYRVCKLTVLPSINATESFGMVQVESMMSGTPVIASDLPGVRQPVQSTGMGLIVPPMDADGLAKAMLRVLDEPQAFAGNVAMVRQRFAPQTIAGQYEAIFYELIHSSEQGQARRMG